jgi:hypothetical protein
MDPMLAALARYRPTVAAGVARRWLDGSDPQDTSLFAYAALDRWRVRRAAAAATGRVALPLSRTM